MTQPLTVMLARVGLLLATRGPWARLRGVALAGGAATLALGIAGLALHAGYAAQRQARADAIRPHLAASPDEATSLYAFNGFTDLNDRPVVVISIWPVRPDAPPPPGVARGAWTMSPSGTLAAGCTVGAALLGVALSVWAARQVAHRGKRWHPSLGE